MEDSSNTDSGCQDTSKDEDDDSEGLEMEQDEEDDDEEGRVISEVPLRFPQQLAAAPVTTSASVIPAPHIHTMADVHILGFGQFRHPVVMTPVTLHPRSRTAVAGSIPHSTLVQPTVSQRIASPAAKTMGTQLAGSQLQPTVFVAECALVTSCSRDGSRGRSQSGRHAGAGSSRGDWDGCSSHYSRHSVG